MDRSQEHDYKIKYEKLLEKCQQMEKLSIMNRNERHSAEKIKIEEDRRHETFLFDVLKEVGELKANAEAIEAKVLSFKKGQRYFAEIERLRNAKVELINFESQSPMRLQPCFESKVVENVPSPSITSEISETSARVVPAKRRKAASKKSPERSPSSKRVPHQSDLDNVPTPSITSEVSSIPRTSTRVVPKRRKAASKVYCKDQKSSKTSMSSKRVSHQSDLSNDNLSDTLVYSPIKTRSKRLNADAKVAVVVPSTRKNEVGESFVVTGVTKGKRSRKHMVESPVEGKTVTVVPIITQSVSLSPTKGQVNEQELPEIVIEDHVTLSNKSDVCETALMGDVECGLIEHKGLEELNHETSGKGENDIGDNCSTIIKYNLSLPKNTDHVSNVDSVSAVSAKTDHVSNVDSVSAVSAKTDNVSNVDSVSAVTAKTDHVSINDSVSVRTDNTLTNVECINKLAKSAVLSPSTERPVQKGSECLMTSKRIMTPCVTDKRSDFQSILTGRNNNQNIKRKDYSPYSRLRPTLSPRNMSIGRDKNTLRIGGGNKLLIDESVAKQSSRVFASTPLSSTMTQNTPTGAPSASSLLGPMRSHLDMTKKNLGDKSTTSIAGNKPVSSRTRVVRRNTRTRVVGMAPKKM